jgi:hypothetical protein
LIYPAEGARAPRSSGAQRHFSTECRCAGLLNDADASLGPLWPSGVFAKATGVIRIAADGFPVNFFNSESVPGYDIQPVLGMLFLAACRLLEHAPAIGINDFTVADQNLIEQIYNRHREGQTP